MKNGTEQAHVVRRKSGFLLISLCLMAGIFFAGCTGEKKTAVAADGVVEFKYPKWVYYDFVYLAEDLGKTLGINSFGACSEYVTKKYCLDNGVEPGSVRMITAPGQVKPEQVYTNRLNPADKV
jgi:hypothetical protein